jgi:hypothetical protein
MAISVGPDEHAQEAKSDEPSKDTQDGQRQRHLDAKAYEPGFDEIVDRVAWCRCFFR